MINSKNVVETKTGMDSEFFSDDMELDSGYFTDPRNGVKYKTVIIANKIWLAQNLEILKSDNSWIIRNDPNTRKYGALYDWVGAKWACPPGWHLPSKDEWDQLINYLGENAGGKLKEQGTSHWQSPNVGATNETGFTALPAGVRFPDGDFLNFGQSAVFWSSTETNDGKVFYAELSYHLDGCRIINYPYEKTFGLSVRVIKD